MLKNTRVLVIKNHRSAAVRGARAGCAPLDPLVFIINFLNEVPLQDKR